MCAIAFFILRLRFLDFRLGCGLLVVGCWLLIVGCWLLVVGCWLLVVNDLPLPTSPSPHLPHPAT
ncbi:hypothetical protein CEN46_08645 [Fischerella thermalis CCMEE 5318]|uniref:Transmembrane protein n=1 Tax=Fischerella thermalis CCMEE 5318 TaxID=2019666 RepID=A0A2N6LIG4_9CYAN|nr:hypothetical protein CEN46_08645 [Fischerella thermalis CCMEE 5318]